MRAPTERERLGVMLVSMGVTRLVLELVNSKRVKEFRFWHGPRTGDGKLAEVARRRGLNDPVVERMEERNAAYRHRYGADNPEAN